VSILPTGEDPDTFVNGAEPQAGPVGLEALLASSRDLLDFAISSKLGGAGSASIPDLITRDFLPWLARISDRVQQSFLISRVSQLSGISPAHIERELRSLRLHGPAPTSVTSGKETNSPPQTAQALGHLEAEIIGHLFFAKPGELDLSVVTPFIKTELNLDPVWSDLVELLLGLLAKDEAPTEADLSSFAAAQSPEAKLAFERLRVKAGAYTCDNRADLVARIIAACQKKSLQTTIKAMKAQVSTISRDMNAVDAAAGVREILQEISVLNNKLLALETKLSMTI
jgi:hypothetical protein